jgi:hypothetical protein
MFFGNPTVADIDGDGLPEIVTGSGGGLVHAVNALGAKPAGWPKFTDNWMIPVPVVGDIDGDGLLEVATSSREGFLTVWEASGPASPTAVQWNGFRHDRQRTGNFDSGVPAGLVPAGCTAGTFPLKLHVTRVSHGSLPNTDKIKVRADFRVAGSLLDPATDDVELQLATASGTVYAGTAAGGLTVSGSGYKFNAPVPGGGTLTLKLRTKDHVLYKMSGSAKGFAAGTTSPPLATTMVRIGNDCYAQPTPCKANSKGTRETCKPLD